MISDDLPDQDTPVTTVRHPSGIRILIFFKLFSSAQRMAINSVDLLSTKCRRTTRFFPARYLQVSESSAEIISSKVPINITSPPWTPARGPMSMI